MQFTVFVTFKNPAWDERSGFAYRGITARDKATAVKMARRRARDDGHMGVLYFKAEVEA